MQVLTVLNSMLGTMGERPVNDIETPHPMKGAALKFLDQSSRRIQAKGWWYNLETITLNPQINGRISLAGDAISVRTPTRSVAQRGRYLYDLTNGTFIFTSNIDVELIRLVGFEDLPESAAQHIATDAVLKFQTRYDGDILKTKQLATEVFEALAEVNADHIRNRRSNFIQSNDKLQRLKQTTNQARRFIR